MKKTLFINIAALFLSAISTASYAQLIVAGKGPQQTCYESAFYGNAGTKSAIKACDEGLERAISRKDRAATFVNRGILLMRNGDFTQARADYENAIAISPRLAEAYMNYGAVLIHLSDLDGALTALNTAIEDLEPRKMHQALYNRAIVYDRQDKHKDAYLDLKRALELRPEWDDALRSLKRYTVVSKNSG